MKIEKKANKQNRRKKRQLSREKSGLRISREGIGETLGKSPVQKKVNSKRPNTEQEM